MAAYRDKLRTILALGLSNVARVAAYRIGLKTGLHPVLKIRAAAPTGPFFDIAPALPEGALARQGWQDDMPYFTTHRFPLDGETPPDWFANPFVNGAHGTANGAWHGIADFSAQVGDIKTVWEASRFEWAIAFAQRAVAGEAASLDRLNAWIADWVDKNPPYEGSNWKCGQEASLRVLHLAAAGAIAGVDTPMPGLRDLITLHLRRIAPTIGYAIGQSNNHGTSEAAALFVGGSWLGGSQGDAWAATGSKWLEDRARVLIDPDGTFCQYSVTYHRLMLDTYSFAENWRKRRDLPAFSPKLTQQMQAATHWLHTMMCPLSGHAPNIGTNDGARILAFTDGAYGDMRPTVQLAATLFCDARAVEAAGDWDQPLRWLGVTPAKTILPATPSTSFDQGGFHVLQSGTTKAVLRYPRFRFRPGQADALHVDLWHDGRNLLRDTGTYSYASDERDWAAGTSAHNTACFDDRDQMPRLGRFLFGGWLRARNVQTVTQTAQGIHAATGYVDAWGAAHHRAVTLGTGILTVNDTLSGTAQNAVIRWRVPKGAYTLNTDGITGEGITMRVTTDSPIKIDLKQSWESRHYLEKSPVCVLEVTCPVPATILTEVSF